jgi:hypothetical protein
LILLSCLSLNLPPQKSNTGNEDRGQKPNEESKSYSIKKLETTLRKRNERRVIPFASPLSPVENSQERRVVVRLTFWQCSRSRQKHPLPRIGQSPHKPKRCLGLDAPKVKAGASDGALVVLAKRHGYAVRVLRLAPPFRTAMRTACVRGRKSEVEREDAQLFKKAGLTAPHPVDI